MLNHFVPQGHKVALADIADGGNIVRYGEVIGTAKGAIRRGDWVNEDNVVMGSAPPLDQLQMATRAAARAGAADRLHLRRLSQCRRHGGDQEYPGRFHQRAMRRPARWNIALKRIKAELLPKYPNVDDVVVLTHAYGCGVAINAPDAVVPIRTLQNLARNPNFGGEVLVVGLGCEKLAPERLLPEGQRRHPAPAGRGLCRLRRHDRRHHGTGGSPAEDAECNASARPCRPPN